MRIMKAIIMKGGTSMTKRIDIDDDVYTYIAAQTQHIGESASDILRRLLKVPNSTSESPKSDAMVPTPASASAAPKAVFDVLNKADFAGQKSVVARFLHILAMLYRCHADEFSRVLEVRGRDRIYFATSEQALLEAGNSTNPKQIPGAPFWVITNNNTTRKKSMLTQVAKELGYDDQAAEKIRDFL